LLLSVFFGVAAVPRIFDVPPMPCGFSHHRHYRKFGEFWAINVWFLRRNEAFSCPKTATGGFQTLQTVRGLG